MLNRLKYDKCAAETVFSDNVTIYDHLMDVTRFVHNSPCMHGKGLVGGNTASTLAPVRTPDNVSEVFAGQVAVENDLRGQTRPVTRCPLYDFLPENGKSTSKELYKPVVHPVLLLDAMNNLEGCQMISYSEPAPPGAAAPAGSGSGRGSGSGGGGRGA